MPMSGWLHRLVNDSQVHLILHLPCLISGVTCDVEINECQLYQPCLNNATCVDLLASYECLCPVGFSGENCETNLNDCVGAPCLNGATCVDGVETYTCQCVPGYTGKHNVKDIRFKMTLFRKRRCKL